MTEKQTVKFGDICREVKLTTKDPIADGYDKYIGLEHLDSGSLKLKRWGIIAEDNPSFTRVFKKGQLLFGKRRSYLKKAAIAEFDGVCSGDIIVMEPYGDLMLPELLPFIVQSKSFWDYAIKTSSGSLSPRTKFKSLANFELDKVDKSSQILKLDLLQKSQKLFSSYDTAIKSIDTLRDVLISKEFGSLLKCYSAKTFNELIKSGDILGIQDGNHGNDHPKASDYVETGVPFIMASDLNDGKVDLINCKYLTRERADRLRIGFSKPNDVLLTHKGTVGLVARTPGLHDYIMLTPQVTYYRVNPSGEILADYLEIFFRSRLFQVKLKKLAAQSTRDYIGITAQKLLSIPLPPKAIQIRLIKIWNDIQITKDQLIKSNNAVIQTNNCLING